MGMCPFISNVKIPRHQIPKSLLQATELDARRVRVIVPGPLENSRREEKVMKCEGEKKKRKEGIEPGETQR
jgi:hypothetical protein